MELVIGIGIVAALFVVSIVAELVATNRCRRSIERWTSQNGYAIESLQRRWLSLGPWQWRGNRSRRVFFLTAVDSTKLTRSGYARIGGGLGGLIADDVEVRWLE